MHARHNGRVPVSVPLFSAPSTPSHHMRPPSHPPFPLPFPCFPVRRSPSPLHRTLFAGELTSLLKYRNRCTNALLNDRRRKLFQVMYAPGTKVCCSTSRGWVPGTISSVQSHAISVSCNSGEGAASSLHTLVPFKDCRSKIAFATPDGYPTHATLEVRDPNMS